MAAERSVMKAKPGLANFVEPAPSAQPRLLTRSHFETAVQSAIVAQAAELERSVRRRLFAAAVPQQSQSP